MRLTLCSKAKEICEEIRRKNMSLFGKALKDIELKDAVNALEILQKMVNNIE